MIVFFVLGWVTMHFVWPNLISAIDERRQKIAEGLSAAEKSVSSLSETNEKVKHMLDEAKKESQVRIVTAEKQVTKLLEKARSDAELEKSRILLQAQCDVDAILRHAKDELRNEVSVLSIKGAEQILMREINMAEHREILDKLEAQL
ncbi:F-type H+-transporting ATPase subunit b [Candidatus Kinetoplastibacterium desouzaii TCC079E]|uniref:ATP synthase subunit b n=2 Tax=Candidatus Kinetoplastidibacterium desouzai TaxID=994692 RepID=M1LLH9_9PROT|nr:F-type H+-transporting ATPase subunit b [Candidatus Kinetoplastibacterium desouzaii TCC079E]